jgi:hypothetical protein
MDTEIFDLGERDGLVLMRTWSLNLANYVRIELLALFDTDAIRPRMGNRNAW